MAKIKVIESWEEVKKDSILILSSEGLDSDVITYEISTLKGGKKTHLLSQFKVVKKSLEGLYFKPKGYRGFEKFVQFNQIGVADFLLIV
jgi:hypothetical protein